MEIKKATLQAMGHVQQLAEARRLRNEPEPESVNSLLRQEHMTRFWERMSETFGRQWEASYGTTEERGFATWTEGLADMSLTEIGDGFRRMVKSGLRFPPNLPEFRAHCRPDEGSGRTYLGPTMTQEQKKVLLSPPDKQKSKAAAAVFFEQARKLGVLK